MVKKQKKKQYGDEQDAMLERVKFPAPPQFNTFEDNPTEDWHFQVLSAGGKGTYVKLDKTAINRCGQGFSITLKEESNDS